MSASKVSTREDTSREGREQAAEGSSCFRGAFDIRRERFDSIRSRTTAAGGGGDPEGRKDFEALRYRRECRR